MLDALLRSDALRANDVADEVLRSGGSTRQLIDDVIAPSLRDVGERWADGEMSLIQEHLATAAAEAVIARLRRRVITGRGHWLVATLVGEQHRVGASMAAATISELGWPVDVCENLTADAVAESARDRPGVCLACAGPWSIREAREAALRVAATGTPVLLGGRGWEGWSQPPRIRLISSMADLESQVRAIGE
jgi:MerR family transcriptional regulator, light-induced transcriptional regulator